MNEFSIIDTYFKNLTPKRDDVVLGIGDDCALLCPPKDQLIAVSTDTLVAGVHFFDDVAPKLLGYKSLAVNLSDLAAVGAQPAWVTLCLTLPEMGDLGDNPRVVPTSSLGLSVDNSKINATWLREFCDGFGELAKQHQVTLVGGDLTRGPLSISVQIQGFVPETQALRRDAAQVDDLIYVSGTLGDAAAGLSLLQHSVARKMSILAREYLLSRLHLPTPRVELGVKLRNISHAAIDVSDGLMADLGHILQGSNVGATIYTDKIPLSLELTASFSLAESINFALTGGDDYELCFTVTPAMHKKYAKQLAQLGCSCIGVIEATHGLRVIDQNGKPLTVDSTGYKHF